MLVNIFIFWLSLDSNSIDDIIANTRSPIVIMQFFVYSRFLALIDVILDVELLSIHLVFFLLGFFLGLLESKQSQKWFIGDTDSDRFYKGYRPQVLEVIYFPISYLSVVLCNLIWGIMSLSMVSIGRIKLLTLRCTYIDGTMVISLSYYIEE